MNIHPISLNSILDDEELLQDNQVFKTKKIKFIKRMNSPKIFKAIEPKEANIGLRNKNFINP